MRKLIIDLMGLEEYEKLEGTMDFYPDGLKGLIADYLTHHRTSPSLWADTDERDQAFFQTVLEQYERSHQAMLDNMSERPFASIMVMVLLYTVATTVQQIVLLQEENLRHAVLDSSRMDWGRDYVLVPLRH